MGCGVGIGNKNFLKKIYMITWHICKTSPRRSTIKARPRRCALVGQPIVLYLVMCPAYIRPSPPFHAVIIVNSLLLSLSLSSHPSSTSSAFSSSTHPNNETSKADFSRRERRTTTSWFSDRRSSCPRTAVPRVVSHTL